MMIATEFVVDTIEYDFIKEMVRLQSPVPTNKHQSIHVVRGISYTHPPFHVDVDIMIDASILPVVDGVAGHHIIIINRSFGIYVL
jgi:hypothetical protein